MAQFTLLVALIAILYCSVPMLSVRAAPVGTTVAALGVTDADDMGDETDGASSAAPAGSATNAPGASAGTPQSSATENPDEPVVVTGGASSNAPVNLPTEEPESTDDSAVNSQSSTPEPVSQTTTTSAPYNGTCSDLRSNCDASRCDDDHTRFLCANTCQSCQLRDQCYNAYGDQLCYNLDFLCDTLPIVQSVCKRACGKCQANVNSTDCTNIAKNCDVTQCAVNNNNFWCAHTCGTCADAARCQDALDANTCGQVKSLNQCSSAPYFQVVCKKTCDYC